MIFDPACAAAVAALENDPFYRSICASAANDPPRRREILTRYFDYSIREGQDIGLTVRPPDPSHGVAVWLLPQSSDVDARAARKKRFVLQETLDAEGCANYNQIAEYMSAKACGVVGEDAWYLSIVAVDPAFQGQGLGRQLLESTIAEADRAGATCYLETFSERNLSFYQRLGFAAKARFREPITGAD